MLLRVPQGSILSPLFFIVFIWDLLYFEEYIGIASCFDNTTPYNTDYNIENIISSLESSFAKLFNWFSQNTVKVNPDKYHLLSDTNQNKLGNIIFPIAHLRNYLNHHWHTFHIYVNKLCFSETKCSCTNCTSHECRQKRVCYEKLNQFAF